MNGRIYDPVLGRFLSADPFIDGTSDSQGFNRYSYVANNPLNATDPSGYLKLKEILPAIIAVVVTAVVIVATGGAALPAAAANWGWGAKLAYLATHFGAHSVLGGMAGGFASGFSGSLLNGGSIGDAFQAGFVGGVVGAVSAGIAYGIGELAEAYGWFSGPLQHLSHGLAQGGLTEATGGEFRHGFYAGSFSSAFAGPIAGVFPTDALSQSIAAAVVGGTASTLGGGKFANGAISGAFTYLFNAKPHRDLSELDGKGLHVHTRVGKKPLDYEIMPAAGADNLDVSPLTGHENTFDRDLALKDLRQRLNDPIEKGRLRDLARDAFDLLKDQQKFRRIGRYVRRGLVMAVAVGAVLEGSDPANYLELSRNVRIYTNDALPTEARVAAAVGIGEFAGRMGGGMAGSYVASALTMDLYGIEF